MKKTKALITIAMVGLLVSMAVFPSITAQIQSSERTVTAANRVATTNPTDGKSLRILTTLNDDVEIAEANITQQTAQNLNETLNNFKNYANNLFANYWKDGELDDNEKAELKNKIEDLIDKIREVIPNLPEIDVDELLGYLLPSMALLIPMISVGYGKSKIPFYGGEAFFGFMLRPINLYHIIGYTGLVRLWPIPPRIEYTDRLGMHATSVWGFAGIYVDLGDIGIDTRYGTTLLLGAALFGVGLSEDIP